MLASFLPSIFDACRTALVDVSGDADALVWPRNKTTSNLPTDVITYGCVVNLVGV